MSIRKKVAAWILMAGVVLTSIPMDTYASERLNENQSNVAAYTNSMVHFLNSGYPYGKDMKSDKITLVIDTEDVASSYQWQMADSRDGAYVDISGATKNSNTFTPVSGKWYRCIVDGTESKAVMAVKPEQDVNVWTNPSQDTQTYEQRWYISNGYMAYMYDNDSYRGPIFDATGLFEKDGRKYMLATSYDTCWNLFSSSSATPSEGDTTGAQLDAFRVSFEEKDAYRLTFEADLEQSQQSFSFGCDTMLGNYVTSSYADNAALSAMMDGDKLKQIAMVGAQTVEGAKDEDPAFVIAPVTAANYFWIGKYSSRMTYAYNTTALSGVTKKTLIGKEEVATLLEGTDSGMTMSWVNVPSGGSIRFQFSVGSVANTGAVGGKVDYENEQLVGLEANVKYVITADGKEMIITSSADGTISLSGTTDDGNPYDLTGKTVVIAKDGSSDTPSEVEVGGRPQTPSTPSNREEESNTPSQEEKIEISEMSPSSVTICPKEGQEYSYSVDGTNWIAVTEKNSDGNYVIRDLEEGAELQIRTRIPATENTPASNWSGSTQVKLKSTIHASASDYHGYYDGDKHCITVAVNPAVEGYSITYSLQEDGQYQAELPEIRNVGDYTVYYRVVADGYYPTYGSARVAIEKKDLYATRVELDENLGINSIIFSGLSENESLVKDADYEYDVDSDDGEQGFHATVRVKLKDTAVTRNYNLVNSDIRVDHTHEWQVQKDSSAENKILVYCNQRGDSYECAYYGSDHALSVQTDAFNRQYSGNVYDGLRVNCADVTKATGLVPTITYYVDDALTEETSPDNSGSEYIGGAPKNAGDYWVKTQIGNSYMNTAFHISRKSLKNAEIVLDQGDTQATGQTVVQRIAAVVLDGETLQADAYEIDSESVLSAQNYGTYTIKINGKGNYEDSASVTWNITDLNAPTGSMRIGDDVWKSFLNTISFGFFYKDHKKVEIHATDGVCESGVDKVYYLVSEQRYSSGTDIANAQWVEGDHFYIDANAKIYLYAKLVDKAGNISYISSDGIVLYTDSVCDTNEITYTKLSGEKKDIHISLNGNTVQSVMNVTTGNELIQGEDYTIDGETITLMNRYMQDLAADTYTIKVSYNPGGVDFTQTSLGECPLDSEITLYVKKAEGTISDISDLTKTYDGLNVEKPEFDTTNDRGQNDANVSIMYKRADESDDAYSIHAPSAAGLYMVKVSVQSDTNYTEAVATRTFTIYKDVMSVSVKPINVVYDGLEHQAEIKVENPADTTILYGMDSQERSVQYSEKPLSFKNAGEYKVYYKIIADNYITYTGNTTICIAPKEVKLSWSETDFVYDGNRHMPFAEVDAASLVSSDSCEVRVEGEAMNAGDHYTATAISLSNGNYKLPEACSIGFKIDRAPLVLRINNVTKHIGKMDPELTYEILGNIADGDEIEGISLFREAGESEGTYFIHATEQEGQNPNYNISKEDGLFTVEGHEYRIGGFIWNDDLTQATAVFRCVKDCMQESRVECNVTSVTTDPTCTMDGRIQYTAKCLFDPKDGKGIRTYTDMKQVPIAATGHAYGEPVFEWNADDTIVKAEFVCRNDVTHVLTKSCKVTKTTIPATCLSSGSITYSASVTFSGQEYTDSKQDTLQALGHDWSGKWNVITKATASHSGKKEKACARGCGYKMYDIIPAENDKAESGNPVTDKIDKGVEIAQNVPIKEATLDNKKQDIFETSKIFTEDEKKQIKNGKSARVWLQIKSVDFDNMPNADKRALEKTAEQITGQKNSKLTYFDTSLYKQMEGGEETSVINPGTSIKISIKVPDELANQKKDTKREYKIISLKDGKAEVITGVYHPETGEVTFETSALTVCAITYIDTKIPEMNEEDSKENQIKPSAKNDSSVISPKTMDESDRFIWLVIALFGCIVFTGLSLKKRNEYCR